MLQAKSFSRHVTHLVTRVIDFRHERRDISFTKGIS